MTRIVESYKKIFENKKIHIGLFIITFLWTATSILLDIASGRGDNYKQNIFDILFGLFVGVHSLQFLHNAINNINSGIVPKFREIKPEIFFGMIKLDIVWGFYAVAVIIASVIIYMTTVNTLILPITAVAVTGFLAIFAYYVYLAYAEKLNTKGLFNITLIFKFIKHALKDTLIKFCLFVLITLLAILICILVYTAAAITNIDTIGHIAGDYYAVDFIVITLAGYFTIITWYYAYPYSLTEIYISKIRPLLTGKEDINDENV